MTNNESPLKSYALFSEHTDSASRVSASRNAALTESEILDSPVKDSDRIQSIDVLRGFALLGILILNIQSFGLVGAKYLNPNALGPIEGTAFFAWWVTHVFGELKFMTIFSMLFGAGIVLMWSREAILSGCKIGSPLLGKWHSPTIYCKR